MKIMYRDMLMCMHSGQGVALPLALVMEVEVGMEVGMRRSRCAGYI